MLTITKNKVSMPRTTWDEKKMDTYYSKLIEAIEDREQLLQAKEEATEFFDFREYHSKRMKEINNV